MLRGILMCSVMLHLNIPLSANLSIVVLDHVATINVGPTHISLHPSAA